MSKPRKFVLRKNKTKFNLVRFLYSGEQKKKISLFPVT